MSDRMIKLLKSLDMFFHHWHMWFNRWDPWNNIQFPALAAASCDQGTGGIRCEYFGAALRRKGWGGLEGVKWWNVWRISLYSVYLSV